MRVAVVAMIVLAGCMQVADDEPQDGGGVAADPTHDIETRSPGQIWEEDHAVEEEVSEPFVWEGDASLPAECEGERRGESPVHNASNGSVEDVAAGVAEALSLGALDDGRAEPRGWVWNTSNGHVSVSDVRAEDVRPNTSFEPVRHSVHWRATEPLPAEESLLAVGRHFVPDADWQAEPGFAEWSLDGAGLAHVDPTWVTVTASFGDARFTDSLDLMGVYAWLGDESLDKDRLALAGEQWADCWWEAGDLPGEPGSRVLRAWERDGHAVVQVLWTWSAGFGRGACHVQMVVDADPVNGSSEVVEAFVKDCDGS